MNLDQDQQNLSILFEDEDYIAVYKYSGLLVHRSEITEKRGVYAMLKLRDQIGQHVYPCHRLDRPTSGVLVFAKNAEASRLLQQEFINNKVYKEYWAVVRGWMEDVNFTNSVKSKYDKVYKEAETLVQCVSQTEVPIALGKYSTCRYSLVKAMPKTGRTHQIRLHLRSAFHPIIGDTRYGDNKHNHMFEEKFGNHRLLLHAYQISFTHPMTKKEVRVQSELPKDFKKIISNLNLTSKN